jgi:hypothetical protein
LLGDLGHFEVILEEVAGDVERDEDGYKELLDFLRGSWARCVEGRDLIGNERVAPRA